MARQSARKGRRPSRRVHSTGQRSTSSSQERRHNSQGAVGAYGRGTPLASRCFRCSGVSTEAAERTDRSSNKGADIVIAPDCFRVTAVPDDRACIAWEEAI